MVRTMNCDLILALDVETAGEARSVLRGVGDAVGMVKIGLQLFTRHGPDLVKEIGESGHKVFLDLKLHDIPNTVAKAVESLASLPVSMLTLHASGGSEMMRAAETARVSLAPGLLLLGVTVLTSMDEPALRATGVGQSPPEQVRRLARLAKESGLRGLVCSPMEAAALRRDLGGDMTLVTPGVRPAGGDTHEQKRVATPASAARAGANWIVVGRPILQATDPRAAALAIRRELAAANGSNP